LSGDGRRRRGEGPAVPCAGAGGVVCPPARQPRSAGDAVRRRELDSGPDLPHRPDSLTARAS